MLEYQNITKCPVNVAVINVFVSIVDQFFVVVLFLCNPGGRKVPGKGRAVFMLNGTATGKKQLRTCFPLKLTGEKV